MDDYVNPEILKRTEKNIDYSQKELLAEIYELASEVRELRTALSELYQVVLNRVIDELEELEPEDEEIVFPEIPNRNIYKL
ncbi:MAG: hypothetical protein J7K22_00615 [Nanoarchaeota archaeon]|nr:hypothetical protein [Nanoarchaeota archaeon]